MATFKTHKYNLPFVETEGVVEKLMDTLVSLGVMSEKDAIQINGNFDANGNPVVGVSYIVPVIMDNYGCEYDLFANIEMEVCDVEDIANALLSICNPGASLTIRDLSVRGISDKKYLHFNNIFG